MTFTYRIISHSDVSKETLLEIAEIKSVRWSYSLEEQLNWMNKNLKSNDYHLLIYANDIVIAYANFVAVEAFVNENSIQFMGIGNVCTLESGKGYGDILMKSINDTIITQNWKGVLLCKDYLISYYEKYDWILVEAYKITPQTRENILIFNFENIISKLELSNYKF